MMKVKQTCPVPQLCRQGEAQTVEMGDYLSSSATVGDGILEPCRAYSWWRLVERNS